MRRGSDPAGSRRLLHVVPDQALVAPTVPLGRIPALRLRAFRREPLAVLRALAEAKGDVACARIGSRRLVVLSHPDHIHHALVANACNYVRATVHKHRRLEEVEAGHGADGFEIDLASRRIIQPAAAGARARRSLQPARSSSPPRQPS